MENTSQSSKDEFTAFDGTLAFVIVVAVALILWALTH